MTDMLIRNALRIEDVLRGLKEAEPAPTAEPSADEPTRP